MIYYPIETLHAQEFAKSCSSPAETRLGIFCGCSATARELGLDAIYYAYQEGERGIADALALCEHFAAGERIVVILGDNILEADIAPMWPSSKRSLRSAEFCLKEVDDAATIRRAGLRRRAHRGDRGEAGDSKEPLRRRRDSICSTGASSITFAPLTPSQRGELEIADVHNRYIREGELHYDVLEGAWSDAGTFESLFRRRRASLSRAAESAVTPSRRRPKRRQARCGTSAPATS